PGGLIDGLNLFRFCRDNPGTFMDINGETSERSEVELPESDAIRFFMRYAPKSAFNNRLVNLLAGGGFRLLPSETVRNVKRESTAFVLKKIDTVELKSIALKYHAYDESIRLIKIRGSTEKKIYTEAGTNKNAMRMTLADLNDSIVEEQSENDREETGGKTYYNYKLVRKRNFMDKLLRRPSDPEVYGISRLSVINNAISVDVVITHPYTQYSRLTEEQKKTLGATKNETSLTDEKFNITYLGTSLALRSVIETYKKSGAGVEGIVTQATNERSKRIFGNMPSRDIATSDENITFTRTNRSDTQHVSFRQRLGRMLIRRNTIR
ncbi:hypothetical protein, partial [Enterobacter cloacae]|uniref:hypothetical protein n=1 Tax=Enterobacter cloacae TaxID=550 RepID=UPI0021D18212